MSATSTVERNWIEDPPFIQKLLGDKNAGLFWLFPRLWLGYRWLDAAIHKVDNPAWVAGGEAIKGYWLNATSFPEAGRPPIAFDWYRSFIQALLDIEAYTWFGKLVAYGELLVGIALIVGAFTGIAAFFGALMNWNFMMAGSASTNPVLFLLAIGLILAWKVAGYLGFDYFLLPRLGTPWSRKRSGRGETEKPG
ncbi:MAG: DoxX family membrane protein [Anaerolineales bacterium]|nr:DoxX family membrane protein [Anaerolineales bacterium]